MNTQNHCLGDLEEIQNLKLERDQSLIREKVLREAIEHIVSGDKFHIPIISIAVAALKPKPPTNLIVVDKAEWERLKAIERDFSEPTN